MFHHLVRTEYPYREKWLRVRKDILKNNAGETREYPVAEIGAVAAVLAFDDENNIILQREYRYPLKKTVIEISCGALDENEKDSVAAAREFHEETGFEIDTLEKVGVWNVLTGKAKIDLHMFIGKIKHNQPENQVLDPLEVIESFKVPAPTVVKMILSGEITNAEHIALILVAKEKYPERFQT